MNRTETETRVRATHTMGAAPARRALALVLLLLTGAAPLQAGSWAKRARQMNRRRISANEARERAAEEERERRNKLAMRRIKPRTPGPDWDADPTALPSVLYQIGKRTELPVYIDNEGIDVGSDEIYEYSVLYLTAHRKFTFTEKEVENLAHWLRRGGTLWLDDCYLRGSAFAEAVPLEVAKVAASAEAQWLLKDDPQVADAFKMFYPTAWPGESGAMENRLWQYFVIDGRPAIFFSPNDDGCGWEYSTPPSASNPIGNPIGHGGNNKQREIMFQWATNWFLYVYTH